MPDQIIDLAFPVAGIDLTTEFELQPAGTTPVAINVRAIDPATQRTRGAARCGVSRYVPEKVGGLTGLIQHLNIIVDPTPDWTLAAQEDADVGPTADGGDGSGILDSSDNPDPNNERNRGRYFRSGGSGIRPRKQIPRARHTSTSAIAFVQKKTINVIASVAPAGPARTDHITFNAPVKADSLIVVCAYSANAATVAVSDDRSGGSNTYTVAKELNNGDVLMNMSWARATDAATLTIAVDWFRLPRPFASLIEIFEYSGVFTGGGNAPVEDTAQVTTTLSGFPTGDFTVTMPDLNTSGAPPGRLVLAMWDINLLSPLGGNATCGPSNNPSTGFIIRGQISDTLGPFAVPSDYLFVTEGLPITTGNVGPTLSFTLDGSDFQLYCNAIGASFKRT